MSEQRELFDRCSLLAVGHTMLTLEQNEAIQRQAQFMGVGQKFTRP